MSVTRFRPNPNGQTYLIENGTGTIYRDDNNNGQLDATDTRVSVQGAVLNADPLARTELTDPSAVRDFFDANPALGTNAATTAQLDYFGQIEWPSMRDNAGLPHVPSTLGPAVNVTQLGGENHDAMKASIAPTSNFTTVPSASALINAQPGDVVFFTTFVPPEQQAAYQQQIAAATARGVIVVVGSAWAAGTPGGLLNIGYQDAGASNPWNDPTATASDTAWAQQAGAIVVGINDGVTYGTPGPDVMVSGRTFSGAASMVGFAMAQVQSAARQQLGRPLTPAELRQVFAGSGAFSWQAVQQNALSSLGLVLP